MWFSRIISSFFGIRKKNDLEDESNKEEKVNMPLLRKL